MRGILLNLIQVFSSAVAQPQGDPAGSLADIDWLNTQKQYLFLNPEEVYFSTGFVTIREGDVKACIEWKNIEFFLYPFIGLNIKFPRGLHASYFSLILKEEKESDPLLNEFIIRLSRQSGKRPFR